MKTKIAPTTGVAVRKSVKTRTSRVFPTSGELIEQSTRRAIDAEYPAFLTHINLVFRRNTTSRDHKQIVPLFTTNVSAEKLWETYLQSFHSTFAYQHHNCRLCKNFVQRFGGLVTIDPNTGETISAMWNSLDIIGLYRPAVKMLADLVTGAKVTGVFKTKDAILGSPYTGAYSHMSVVMPENQLKGDRLLEPHQVAAAKLQDYETVTRALADFKEEVVDQAVKLLKTDALYRSEKVLGPAEWLQQLHVSIRQPHVKRANRPNLVWRATALAPAGFCHPRSSMVGTLLDDIRDGLPFNAVAARFAAKMAPLAYLRPQAAPSAGTIAQAEKAFEKLGAASALARRFATLEDIQAFWLPQPTQPSIKNGGVFGHLRPPVKPIVEDMRTPAVTMTWEKFRRTVLPTADTMELHLSVAERYPLAALLTAVDPTAVPIIAWDREDLRNPVSWYLWNHGSLVTQFSLGGGWHTVEALTLKPSSWNSVQHPAHPEGVLFVIKNARETRPSGIGLFPEIMRPEFHSMRSVIEAYSRNGVIEGMDRPHVCGLMQSKGDAWVAHVRVTSNGLRTEYKLDRWD